MAVVLVKLCHWKPKRWCAWPSGETHKVTHAKTLVRASQKTRIHSLQAIAQPTEDLLSNMTSEVVKMTKVLQTFSGLIDEQVLQEPVSVTAQLLRTLLECVGQVLIGPGSKRLHCVDLVNTSELS
jgi:hypothetical protein